jgi:hypothetical protein
LYICNVKTQICITHPQCVKKIWLYFDLMICDKYGGENTGPQSVKSVKRKETVKISSIASLWWAG